jgi:CheY-like chemotaxis protein
LTPAVQSTLEALTWSAISRMREVISEASGGAIQYPERAPEGAVMVTGRSALRHARHPSADNSNLRGRRVLVADDDSSVVWFLSSILRAAGAEVFEARDGLEALRVARRSLPDLIISDVMMPELDGFALCRNLKRDVLLSDVPVILLSWKEDLLQRVH